MQNSQPSLIARDDTLLGICQALGEDLGFNPVWLRVALAIGLLWNPTAMVVAYLAAGVVVALSRWLYPTPRVAADQPAEAGPAAEAQAAAEEERLPIAA